MDALTFTSCGSGSDDNGHDDDESYVCMTGNNATLSSRLLQNYIIFLLYVISLLIEVGKCSKVKIQVKRD